MAIKYGIFGAAFNGDGTTSSEAGSDGAAAAWKIDQAAGSILEGTTPTYGSIAAGDVVYIRSKTGNGANANISVTIGANKTYGNASGTAANPITWILDDGTVWSGVNGTLTYTTASSFGHTLRAGNRFVARTRNNWIIENTQATLGISGWAAISGVVDGIMFNLPNRTGSGAANVTITNAGPHRLSMYAQRTSSLTAGGLFLVNTASPIRLIDPRIEIGSAANAGSVLSWSTAGRVHILGGEVFGAGATTGTTFVYGPGNVGLSANVDTLGFAMPNTMTPLTMNGANVSQAVVSMVGLDGGVGGQFCAGGVNADSRGIGGNYPYLNATLPDSGSTGTGWRVAPTTNTSFELPLEFRMTKLYTDTAATKTVTLEFLLPQSWGGGTMDKRSTWIEVCYIDDATGSPVRQSTYDAAGGAFSSSTASWSATTWGAVNFDKKKLSLTTTASIKQDTLVTVALFCTAASGGANDVLIVCPDPQLS